MCAYVGCDAWTRWGGVGACCLVQACLVCEVVRCGGEATAWWCGVGDGPLRRTLAMVPYYCVCVCVCADERCDGLACGATGLQWAGGAHGRGFACWAAGRRLLGVACCGLVACCGVFAAVCVCRLSWYLDLVPTARGLGSPWSLWGWRRVGADARCVHGLGTRPEVGRERWDVQTLCLSSLCVCLCAAGGARGCLCVMASSRDGRF